MKVMILSDSHHISKTDLLTLLKTIVLTTIFIVVIYIKVLTKLLYQIFT